MVSLDEIQKALAKLVKQEAIEPWLRAPNPAFDGAAPLELLERGETDRLWRMIHELAGGLIVGARQRELTARHLLLHPELVKTSPAEDLAALREYIGRKGWRSLYGHDRRMYRLLRAGVEPCLANLRDSTAGDVNRQMDQIFQEIPPGKRTQTNMARTLSEERERIAPVDPRACPRDLARLVRRERKRRGWTQEQLAKKAKLSVSTVQLVEGNQEKKGSPWLAPFGWQSCWVCISGFGMMAEWDWCERHHSCPRLDSIRFPYDGFATAECRLMTQD